MRKLMIGTFALAFALTSMAMAAAPDVGFDPADKLAEDRPDAPWVTTWYALDGQITNNGGHGPSSEIDWIEMGTGGALIQSDLGTWDGLMATQTTKVDLPDNGGLLGWGVFEIDPADGNNMSTMYGLAPQDNFDTYAIIVVGASADTTATIGTAHDDHAQVWVNGEKVYGNGEWTGAAQRVSYDVEISLNKGRNVLCYRCSEGGGSDYFNLHFDEASAAKLQIVPTPGSSVADFFNDAETSVEPAGKLGTVWGDLKQ